jgi:tetratricopeptide (TPR) repeat protein
VVSWLERAIALRREPPDVGLELELVHALYRRGRVEDAILRADALAERAAAVANPLGALTARIKAQRLRALRGFGEPIDELKRLLDDALPRLEAASDDGLLCHAYEALAETYNAHWQYDQAAAAYDRADAHAARAGLPYDFLAWRSMFLIWGSWPLSRWLAWHDQQEGQHDLRIDHAHALAMLGRIDEARAELASVQADLAERGPSFRRALMGWKLLLLELHGGDPEAALEAGRRSCEEQERLGALAGGTYASLATACYRTGRFDEADAWTARLESVEGFEFDRRQLHAKLLARQGNYDEAEILAHEAVAQAEKTESPLSQGHAYADLAEVLTLAGNTQQARAALEQALTRYERKEALVLAQRTRERLAALDAAATRRPAVVTR